jgi:small conductance mechanosensitive channel
MNDLDSWLTADFWRERLSELAAWAVVAIPRLVVVLLVALVALKLSAVMLRRVEHKLLTREVADAEHDKRIKTLMSIVHKTLAVAIWAMLALVTLMQVGIDVGPLLAGAGVIGLAVGFGAQELVRDVISGFFMLLENHVRAGDVAIINGTGGLVERVGLRTITLRDLSGVVHVFQNGKVSTVANMTKDWSAMVFDLGVAYKEDTDRVAEVVRAVGSELQDDPAYRDKILEPLELFGVDALGDSAVVLKARIKTKPGDQWSVGREYKRRIKKAFDAAGIEIPFPHRTLYWGDAGPALEVDVRGSAKRKGQKDVAEPGEHRPALRS